MKNRIVAAVEFANVIRSTIIEAKEFIPSFERHLFFSYPVVRFAKDARAIPEGLKSF